MSQPERFDHFMQRALHDPERGYYARHIRTVGGHRADFATSATLSPLLGKALAAEFLDWKQTTRPTPWHIVEIGAGDGSLAAAILQTLPWWTRRRVQYHIVDTSAPLRQQQAERLSQHRVTWHDTPVQAMHACGGKAFLLSNELVDAFPVRVFTSLDGACHELHLSQQQEHFLPVQQPPDSTALPAPEGERREVHESYHQWLQEWLPLWQSGRMVTIDYGDRFPAVYHRRPMGSLRAYFMHQHLTGSAVYQNPGHQDITADVNFTDLIQWSEAMGLTTLSLQSQADFLRPHAKPTDADQYLISEHGPGGAFQVLIQQKPG